MSMRPARNEAEEEHVPIAGLQDSQVRSTLAIPPAMKGERDSRRHASRQKFVAVMFAPAYSERRCDCLHPTAFDHLHDQKGVRQLH